MILESVSLDEKLELAKLAELPEWIQLALVDDISLALRATLAQHTSNPRVLRILAEDKESLVKASVFKNPHLEKQLMMHFADKVEGIEAVGLAKKPRFVF